MRKSTVVLIGILSIPLLTMAYLMVQGATFAVVHNGGGRDTQVSLLISGGNTFERTPDAPLAASGLKFIWFRAKTAGSLSISCEKADGNWRQFPLGQDTPDKFIFALVSLNACEGLSGLHGFSL